MQKLLEWMGCKEKEIISKIEEGRQNGICDFVDVDDPIELNSFCFVKYVKSTGKVSVILSATRKYCLHCKDNDVNIDFDGKVGIVLNGLKSIPIKDHIDYLNRERLKKNEISSVPKKEELRELFARAIACLGCIVKCF